MNLYTVDTAHSLLQQQQLVDAEEILFGDYEVTSTNRRNRNLQVTTLHNGNFLVKQVADKKAENAKTVCTEIALYQHVKENLPHLHALFPTVHYTNIENITLALEFYKEATPLWKYYKERTIHQLPLRTISAAGKLLGELHRVFAYDGTNPVPFLTTELPFVFNLHEPHPRLLSYLRSGGYHFIEQLQSDEALIHLWDVAREMWQINALIHGDVKLDNVIVIPRAGEEEATHLKLVDWEMAQYGDTAWDVAGALQDFIFWWTIMMPNEDTAEAMIKKAPFGFQELQPAITTYWHSYSGVSGLSDTANEELLSKAIFFSGFRCIQTAYEISSKFEHVPPIAQVLFNLGKSIVKDPETARHKLFALSPQLSVL